MPPISICTSYRFFSHLTTSPYIQLLGIAPLEQDNFVPRTKKKVYIEVLTRPSFKGTEGYNGYFGGPVVSE